MDFEFTIFDNECVTFYFEEKKWIVNHKKNCWRLISKSVTVRQILLIMNTKRQVFFLKNYFN
jgi:hypothetical protein